MILCPEFFDGRANGIGRVSQAFFEALSEMAGRQPMVWSANESDDRCRVEEGRGFGRNYPGMMLAALIGSLPGPRPPVIACMHLGLSPVARLLSLRTGAPYVVFLHGVEAWPRVRSRARWGLGRAALLMANSRFTLGRFQRANPDLAGLPSLVTPLGIGRPGPAAEGAGLAGRYVLIVSRMDKADDYKGHRLLIQAMGLAHERFPEATLTVVGQGDDKADIEAFAAGMPQAGEVTFTGRVTDDELDSLYADSAVFALPSAGEGFGLVFLEAMAHGLPCLCGNRDASPEVVLDGITGLCVDPGDVQAVAVALIRLLGDEGLRRQLGHAGRERYLAEFTAEHFKGRIRQALERVIATGKRGQTPCAA